MFALLLTNAGLSGVVVAAFATVFGLWGTPSLVGAIRATVGTASPYLFAYGPRCGSRRRR